MDDLATMRSLRIGGITPFSTVDWPGKLACVAFLAGCPWRCPYCQNHQLQSAAAATLNGEDLLAFLRQRQGLLDGVVFSGGEPLAQAATISAMRAARELGFAVGLHTCGAFPERLREALSYVDWVGLDVKAPWDKYDQIALPTHAAGQGSEASKARTDTGQKALSCLEAILASGVELETRTTWHPDLLTQDDISAIAHDLASRGVRTWAVQAYRAAGTTGELPDETVYSFDVPEDLPSLFETFEFRRA